MILTSAPSNKVTFELDDFDHTIVWGNNYTGKSAFLSQEAMERIRREQIEQEQQQLDGLVENAEANDNSNINTI